MLEAYSVDLAVTANSNITFNTTRLLTNDVALLKSDGQTIALRKAGIYKVEVYASGAPTAEGSIKLQLYGNNNEVIVPAVAEADAGAGVAQSISFASFVKVQPSVSVNEAQLTLKYEGGAGSLSIVNILVTKVR